MSSKRSVQPNQLSKVFGSKAAQCLQQQASQTYMIPKRKVMQIITPVNFVCYAEKNELIPVQAPTEYEQVRMQPQQQSRNSPCPPAQTFRPVRGVARAVASEVACNEACSTGSCRTGPYVPSYPMVGLAAPRAACGVPGAYDLQAPRAAYGLPGGYRGVIPGGIGSQAAYARAPGSASHYAGMYPVQSLAGYASNY